MCKNRKAIRAAKAYGKLVEKCYDIINGSDSKANAYFGFVTLKNLHLAKIAGVELHTIFDTCMTNVEEIDRRTIEELSAKNTIKTKKSSTSKKRTCKKEAVAPVENEVDGVSTAPVEPAEPAVVTDTAAEPTGDAPAAPKKRTYKKRTTASVKAVTEAPVEGEANV